MYRFILANGFNLCREYFILCSPNKKSLLFRRLYLLHLFLHRNVQYFFIIKIVYDDYKYLFLCIVLLNGKFK